MTDFNLSFPIDMIKKEQRIVTGIATADNVDKVGDLVDFSASLEAFKNWQGNIREMHAPIAVGKAISYKPIKIKAEDGNEYNAIQVEAYISKGAESTWQKVLDGTLRAFSIGGKILKKELMQDKSFRGRPVSVIKEYNLGELSLVDNPANAVATIDLVKMATDGLLDYALEIEEEFEKAKQPLRDPKGGLTAAGRRHFKQTEGANLKPGVKGPANTPEKMRRKGSFLTRFFTNPSGPMKKPNGEPTRLALSAAAWGEPVPQDRSDAAKLAAKGRRLLERYRKLKDGNKSYTEDDFTDLLTEFVMENIEAETTGVDDWEINEFILQTLLDDLYEILDVSETDEQDIDPALIDKMSEMATLKKKLDLLWNENLEKKNNNEVNVLKSEENIDNQLQNDINYDNVKPMDNSLTDNKLSMIKKFINWLSPEDNLGLNKSEHVAEVSEEIEATVAQVEEEMDIEVLKEALGSVIDQKLNDFATSFKQEVEESVNTKIEEVTKSVETQKAELAEKLEATEKALEVQTAKVEEFAQAGAVKKSVDPEDDEEGEELTKSAPKSFWGNMYLPQELINSLGYKS